MKDWTKRMLKVAPMDPTALPATSGEANPQFTGPPPALSGAKMETKPKDAPPETGIATAVHKL